ncbi:MAG: aminoglycoside phosphotransferase [Methylomonas sp.]|nr:MAG: aminoglycoside phosphotransferase [Methylomonas sp.]
MCCSNFDARLNALLRWLNIELDLDILEIKPASSDASFRRYFRVTHAGGCHVVMDAPPDKENILPFIRNAKLLQGAQIHVPVIYQQNLRQGFLLLEDLGCQALLDALQTENADSLYQTALDNLFKLQRDLPIDMCPWPTYDETLLTRELGIFYEWFLEKRLGLVLPVTLRQTLNESLIESALQQPQVAVHRDYHSRNLMVLAEDELGVIDFQDAVIGPISYDIVSLLRDCYISWPEQRVLGWLEHYYQRLLKAGMLNCEFVQFKRWFDLMGMQRHLKAVGIFSRLHLRDNKPGYLGDIPRTMQYILKVSQLYPEFAEFHGFLQQQVLPIYQAHL